MTSAHWDTVGPPPLTLFAREQTRAALELAATGERRELLRQAPRGDGHPVLVLPGLLAGDLTTLPLRRFLRALCYDARGWKLGVNLGPREGTLEKLLTRLERLHQRHGRRVSLVGWSLGGIYARELARSHPDLVRLVVTLGSPFRDITATHATRLVPLTANGMPIQEAHDLRVALRRPIPVPSTAVYSKTDGICAWQSCLEEPGPRRESVEVDCSHTGMGFHRETLAVVADRLAQGEGAWQPFRSDCDDGEPGVPEPDDPEADAAEEAGEESGRQSLAG